MRLGQEIIRFRRTRRPAVPVFRKAYRSQFRFHLPENQNLRRKSLTCSEGPFGEVLRATGPMAKANPVRFSTKYQDEETDLLYYGYRYYNASTGKWASRDASGEKAGLNLYGFAANSPTDKADRLGLDVYRVTTSELCATPLHRKIVGDDGKGGGYTLEFFGIKCWYSIGAGGYYVLAKGNVKYQKISQSAADEIKEQGYNVVERIETGNVYYYPGYRSIDSFLAQEAARMEPSDFGSTYVFLFRDCGTFANFWMRHVRQSVLDAQAGWPSFPPWF